jgi:voltage-gated potassium channel
VALRISLVHQVGAAVLLLALTLWLQYAGFTALIAWVRHATATDIHKLGSFRSAGLVIKSTVAVITLHGLQILLWASCYRWLCLPSWESALYFSATSYSTVGYGDVVLPLDWRLLGPLESMLGMIMSGVSVSVLFAIVTRLLDSDEDPRRPNQCECVTASRTRIRGL